MADSGGDHQQIDSGSDQVQKCDFCNEKFSDGFCVDCEAYMCQTCFDRHLKSRQCRHHVLAEDTEHQTEVRKTHAEPCKSHENQIIEFFCVDHKQVGCAKCMLSNHSTCKRQDIDVAAKQFQDHGEDARLSEKIQKVEIMYTDCMKKIQQLTQSVATANDQTVNDIEAFKAAVGVRIDETVGVALEKAEQLRLENETKIERFSDDLEKIRNPMGLFMDSLKSTEESEKLFIVAMDMEPKLAEFQEKLSTLKTEKVTTEYTFQTHKIALDFIQDSRLLGEVLLETEELDNITGQSEQMEMKYNDECKKTQSLEQQLREQDEQITMLSARLSEVKNLKRSDPSEKASTNESDSLQTRMLAEPSKMTSQTQSAPPKMAVPTGAGISKKAIFQTHSITVMAYKASILRLNVDCIVSASNSRLQHGGGVARVISEAAGDELERECKIYIRANRKLSVGQTCTTTAGKLHYRRVIHAVGPTWYDYDKTEKGRKECEDDLMKTVVNTLVEADGNGLKSIALPAISSAIYGVPMNICVTQYARAVQKYSSQQKTSFASTLSEVHFIDVNENTVRAIQTAFIEAFGSVRFEDL